MAGASAKRYALPNSRIMIHQPTGGFRGQATDVEIHAREMAKTKQLLNGLYAKHTGKNIKEVEKAMERDNFMSPEEALKFGLIDKVVVSRREMDL
jgi:ATP-dependent Clp protease protease subunit